MRATGVIPHPDGDRFAPEVADGLIGKPVSGSTVMFKRTATVTRAWVDDDGLHLEVEG